MEKPSLSLWKGIKLYRIKQSPQLWYERLANFPFTKSGLHRLYADYNIFATDQGSNTPAPELEKVKYAAKVGSIIWNPNRHCLCYIYG